MSQLIITPKTKIADLLDAYPQLEDVLISAAPPFKKLKNPVLRKTVAKITTISQAAIIGKLNVEELVNQLRTEIGQGSLEAIEGGESNYVSVQPEWYTRATLVQTIEINDMLNAGEQPVHEVLSELKKLQEGEMLKVKAPFIPAPLIDKSLSLSYKHWLDKQSEEEYSVYFFK